MKRKNFALVFVLILCIATTMIFAGCGSEKYNYDLSEYVKVGNYKGLEYNKINVSVTDKDVQNEINSRLEKAATEKQSTSGTVKEGDSINIDFTGKVDGKEFEGGSAKNQTITLGSSGFIDGFDDGLIGKKIGDKVDLKLTFPDPYNANKELSGKNVVFTVNINSKTIKDIPKYNLDFVKSHSSEKSLKDYEKSVEKDLYDAKYQDALYEVKNKLWETVVSSSDVKGYPDKELKMKEKDVTKQYHDMAEQYKMKWEDFLKQSSMTEEDFNAQVKEYAKTVVGQEMIMYYIADKEGIEVTDKEYDKYLEDMLKQSGHDKESFEKAYGQTLEDYAKANDWRTGLMLDKVLEVVMEKGKVK